MKSSIWWRLRLMVHHLFSRMCVGPILFRTRPFPASHSLDGASLCDHFIAYAYTPWFDERYVKDDNTIIQYVRDDCLPNNILVIALSCDDFRLHMCAAAPSRRLQNLVTGQLNKDFCPRAVSIGGDFVVVFRYRPHLAWIFRLFDRTMSTLFFVGWRWR